MATPQSLAPSGRRSLLLGRARAFCADFASKELPSPEDILEKHFVHDYGPSGEGAPTGTATRPRITEHGPPFARERLPFVGRTFEGRDECLEFFKLLGTTLTIELGEDSFPKEDSGYVVDVEARASASKVEPRASLFEKSAQEWKSTGVVTFVGHGTFRSVKTGKAWDEEFIYRLSEFSESGKCGHLEAWGDPLSAWLAVGNQDASQ